MRAGVLFNQDNALTSSQQLLFHSSAQRTRPKQVVKWWPLWSVYLESQEKYFFLKKIWVYQKFVLNVLTY